MPITSQTKPRHDCSWTIKQLRASQEEGASELADILGDCTDKHPCRSGACLDCGRAFQQTAVQVVKRFIREPARACRDRMTALTIIPASGCLARDDLTVEACQQVGDDITAALASAGLPPTIMFFDISYNEDETGEVEEHWCGHGHGAQVDWISTVHEAALRSAVLPTQLVKRPIRCEPLDDLDRWVRYGNEPERDRRVTYLNTSNPNRAPYRDTRHRDLRPWQAVNLALVDHRLGYHGRVLTHGIDDEAVRLHLEALGWPRDGP